MKLTKFLGRPVRYYNVVPGQSTDTAFVCGFSGSKENRLADLLVMDESKKGLLNRLNWHTGFRRVHGVPHVSSPGPHPLHSFDFMEAENGDGGPAQKATGIPVQSQTPDYADLRAQLDDYTSPFYGPHSCAGCGKEIIKKALELGGTTYEERDPNLGLPRYELHQCSGQNPKRVVGTGTVDESKGLLGAGGLPSAEDLDKVAEEEKAKAATGITSSPASSGNSGS
jgi:hypothetical protein